MSSDGRSAPTAIYGCACRRRCKVRPASSRGRTPTRWRGSSVRSTASTSTPPTTSTPTSPTITSGRRSCAGIAPSTTAWPASGSTAGRSSPPTTAAGAPAALGDLIARLPTPWLILSFSDEGFHRPEDLRALLAERGHLAAIAVDNRRYVGAQIGIHDRRGRRVGAVSHLRNRELLFIVGPRRSLVERAAAAAARALAPARLAVAGG